MADLATLLESGCQYKTSAPPDGGLFAGRPPFAGDLTRNAEQFDTKYPAIRADTDGDIPRHH
jgi:hypothetical protein